MKMLAEMLTRAFASCGGWCVKRSETVHEVWPALRGAELLLRWGVAHAVVYNACSMNTLLERGRAFRERRSKWRRRLRVRRGLERSRRLGFVSEALRHPLFIVLVTFILTGLLASKYQNHLAEITTEHDQDVARREKQHDLEVAKGERASDAVKNITDLIYDRIFKGKMVVSSLERQAPVDEIKERKRTYDEMFTKYNSELQSNMFRIREMFGTIEYTSFESILEGDLRDLLATQDDCITKVYDDAISEVADRRNVVEYDLNHCSVRRRSDGAVSTPHEVTIRKVGSALTDCEYSFTDSLFRSVERSAANQTNQSDMTTQPDPITDVKMACSTSNITDEGGALGNGRRAQFDEAK